MDISHAPDNSEVYEQTTVCTGVVKHLHRKFPLAESHVTLCVRCGREGNKDEVCRFKSTSTILSSQPSWLYPRPGFRRFVVRGGKVISFFPAVSGMSSGPSTHSILQTWNRVCDSGTLQLLRVCSHKSRNFFPKLHYPTGTNRKAPTTNALCRSRPRSPRRSGKTRPPT